MPRMTAPLAKIFNGRVKRNSSDDHTSSRVSMFEVVCTSVRGPLHLRQVQQSRHLDRLLVMGIASVGRRSFVVRAASLLAAIGMLVAGCSSTAPTGHAPGSDTPPTMPSVSNGLSRSTSPSHISAAPSSTPARVTTPPASGIAHFRPIDLTFVSTVQGRALGTADCLSGPGRCTAMAHTLNGGLSWTSTTPPPANIYIPDAGGCAAPCISSIRFATLLIGYAFGNALISTSYGTEAFFMTTDGGQTWRREPGGADALETLDGNVIRVTDPGNCPPGCAYEVETAPIGSSQWQHVTLPGPAGSGDSVRLARTGKHAFIQSYGNMAGGAPAVSVLWSSSDDGATWARHSEPCLQDGTRFTGEVDSTDLTTAPDGSLTILCVHRATGDGFTITSSDDGITFYRAPQSLGAAGASLVGAASVTVLFVDSDMLYRSSDAGAHWQRTQQNSVGPLTASWIGFQSLTIGHVIEPGATQSNLNPSAIWTTRDAGKTWADYVFR
jgi:photosystem II stability/assembly factor-like uncharacterized protein